MKNLVLARKLESYVVNLPSDFPSKLYAISDSPITREFAGAVIHGVNAVHEAGNWADINAMHIIGVHIGIISKMIQNNFLKTEIIEVFNIAPSYIRIFISDSNTRLEAITFWNDETSDLRNHFK